MTTPATRLLREIPLRSVPVVEPQAALDQVLRLLDEEPLGTVVLVGDGMYMGIFNQAARENLVPPGADPATLAVGPYVHPARVIGRPDMSVEQTLARVQRRGQDILPVVQNNRYLGVVTREDLEKPAAAAPV